MSSPVVSVLMVTHNGGRFLEPALRSALDQEGPPLELVLVDNASTDGAVRDVAAKLNDPRLRIVYSPENTWHGGGLNLALNEARGEFVALMDHDDLSAPGRLARQVAFLEQGPEWDGVATFEEEMDDTGTGGVPMFCVRRPEQFLPYSRYDIPFPMHNLMLRRARIVDLGWRNEFSWAMDFDFVQRLLESRRIGMIPETLYRYRVHAGAISARRAHGLRHAATLCRLAAARRRAGRDEGLGELQQELADAKACALPAARMWADYAPRFLQEGFPDLALMLARRAWATGQRIAAVRVALRALAATPSNPAISRGFLWRMAWLGPAHALRVESHPPLRSRAWHPFRSHLPDMHRRVAS